MRTYSNGLVMSFVLIGGVFKISSVPLSSHSMHFLYSWTIGITYESPRVQWYKSQRQKISEYRLVIFCRDLVPLLSIRFIRNLQTLTIGIVKYICLNIALLQDFLSFSVGLTNALSNFRVIYTKTITYLRCFWSLTSSSCVLLFKRILRYYSNLLYTDSWRLVLMHG